MGAREQQTGLTLDQILAIRSIGGSEPPQWSPDGQQLAFVSSLGGAIELWSASPSSGALTRLTVGMGGAGHLLAAYLLQWSPSGDRLAYVSAKSGNDEVWLWAADGSGQTQLTRLGSRIEAMDWAPDGSSMVVASDARGTFDLYRVDVPSGRTTRITNHDDYEVYPQFTPDGRIIYVRLNDAWTDHDVILMDADGANPRVVLQDRDSFDYHYGRGFSYPTVSPDGQTFLFRSDRSGWFNIWAAPVDGNCEPRQIAASEADQSDAVWSPDGSQIAYIENHNGTLDLRLVDITGGDPRVLVSPEMGVCSGPNWSPDGSQISYLFGSPSSPNDVRVVNVASGEQRPLTRSMFGGGVSGRLVAPEKIQYETFDGRMINAYLYRAAGAPEPGSSPGIVWVHGGPTSQYMDTYQPQVQFFLQQGYTVIMPNVRGSSGYGREFEELNNKDWGGGDLKDAIAAANYLKTLPEVDGDHIGITGTSYGGTLSMYAVSFAPGVFQAAIPCSGYCDFVRGFDERELRSQKLYMYEFDLDRSDPEAFKPYSSIYYAHQATTPCFNLHGEGRYPGSDHSKAFAFALEAAYKPFWYKAYQGENYYVASPASVREMLLDMQAFFDFYLKDIPHSLPDNGRRPLTHLSGVVAPAAWSNAGDTSTVSIPPRKVVV